MINLLIGFLDGAVIAAAFLTPVSAAVGLGVLSAIVVVVFVWENWD